MTKLIKKKRNRGKLLTKRAKINLKIKKYKSLNKKFKIYKAMTFDLACFGKDDVPVVGDRMQKKQASRHNYRQRLKCMNTVLDKRIHTMNNLSIGIAGPIIMAEFEPLLEFTSADEADIQAMTDIKETKLNINIFEHI
jgi:hypothetical protein